ncbi:hypothetical protein C8R43DRAFT_956009 [Mycena crocata]|nr:hypothetical protein C8R43DRAFT_956009 [Mycena crocata]
MLEMCCLALYCAQLRHIPLPTIATTCTPDTSVQNTASLVALVPPAALATACCSPRTRGESVGHNSRILSQTLTPILTCRVCLAGFGTHKKAIRRLSQDSTCDSLQHAGVHSTSKLCHLVLSWTPESCTVRTQLVVAGSTIRRGGLSSTGWRAAASFAWGSHVADHPQFCTLTRTGTAFRVDWIGANREVWNLVVSKKISVGRPFNCSLYGEFQPRLQIVREANEHYS